MSTKKEKTMKKYLIGLGILSCLTSSLHAASQICDPPISQDDVRHDNFKALTGYKQPLPAGYAVGHQIVVENTSPVIGFGVNVVGPTTGSRYVHFALYNDRNGSPENRLWSSDVVVLPPCYTAACNQEWSVRLRSSVVAGTYWLFVEESTSSAQTPWAVSDTTNKPMKLLLHTFGLLPQTMTGLSLSNFSVWSPSIYVITKKPQ